VDKLSQLISVITKFEASLILVQMSSFLTGFVFGRFKRDIWYSGKH